MALNSVQFVLFLSAVCVTAYLVPRKIRYVWLLLCSYAFYLYSPQGFGKTWPALALMLAATLLSFLCALAMASSSRIGVKRVFLILSLAGCLGLLLACKYGNFFLSGAGLVASTGALNLILPLGISYYTLQTVSYTVEVYSGTQVAERNPLRYALFVSFFPGLVTGPINRADQMLPQYKNPPRFDYKRVSGGFFRVLWGIFKKMVIADNIGVFTSAVFGDLPARTGPQVVLAALLFAYQLYADFGGCCDIAIGAARMLGFTFAENFNRPFSAKTFPGLWQRWHITLTSFFRDYVFTPLVWTRWTEKLPFIGKYFTKPPMLTATLAVFAISGLWHGASGNYVVWGLLNGCIMAVAQLVGKRKEKLVAKIPLYRSRHLRGFVQRVLVYLLFAFCLVFFSAGLYGVPAWGWFARLGVGWGSLQGGGILPMLATLGLDATTLLVLLCGIVLVELLEKFGVRKASTMADWIRRRRFFIRWPLYYVLLAALLLFGAFGRSPFIYQMY